MINSFHCFLIDHFWFDVLDEGEQLFAINFLFLNKHFGNSVQYISIVGQKLHTSIVLFVENSIDLSINFFLDQTSLHGTGLTAIHASTWWLHISWTNDIAHSHLFDHHFSCVSALLEIVRGSSSYLVLSVNNFLSNSSSKSDTNPVLKVLFGVHT